MADEVQPRTIDADDAVAPRGKAAAIASHSVAQYSKRGSVSSREDHAVERSFGPVEKTHAVASEFRHGRGHLNASCLDCVRQVKTNQRDSRTR